MGCGDRRELTTRCLLSAPDRQTRRLLQPDRAGPDPRLPTLAPPNPTLGTRLDPRPARQDFDPPRRRSVGYEPERVHQLGRREEGGPDQRGGGSGRVGASWAGTVARGCGGREVSGRGGADWSGGGCQGEFSARWEGAHSCVEEAGQLLQLRLYSMISAPLFAETSLNTLVQALLDSMGGR